MLQHALFTAGKSLRGGETKKDIILNLRLSHLPGNLVNAIYTANACYIFGTDLITGT